MKRLASILLALTACTDSGPGTGAASLSNVSPMVKSAAATSFTGPDASGTKVKGWTIDFYKGAPGSDCKSKGTNLVASVGIYTNQAAGSSGKAMLSLGDIGIVLTSPPDTSTGASATMGAVGLFNIEGAITITDFAPDHINGTVAAGGMDANGNGVSMAGMFQAPVCQ
jgi:hypothetical protein